MCIRDSLYAVLAQRFEQYKQHLVRGFYREHFSGFDRQIVLVDCLQALNAGSESFEDVRRSIARIMESFAYGKSNWWRRLFAPRIDKLLFVASKADHVTPDQHDNLVSLLQYMVQSARGQAGFAGIATDCMALAAVCATEVRSGRFQGQEVAGIKGCSLDGEALFINPGAVPRTIPRRSGGRNTAHRSMRSGPRAWNRGGRCRTSGSMPRSTSCSATNCDEGAAMEIKTRIELEEVATVSAPPAAGTPARRVLEPAAEDILPPPATTGTQRPARRHRVLFAGLLALGAVALAQFGVHLWEMAVSYTHLTLPTSDLV